MVASPDFLVQVLILVFNLLLENPFPFSDAFKRFMDTVSRYSWKNVSAENLRNFVSGNLPELNSQDENKALYLVQFLSVVITWHTNINRVEQEIANHGLLVISHVQ